MFIIAKSSQKLFFIAVSCGATCNGRVITSQLETDTQAGLLFKTIKDCLSPRLRHSFPSFHVSTPVPHTDAIIFSIGRQSSIIIFLNTTSVKKKTKQTTINLSKTEFIISTQHLYLLYCLFRKRNTFIVLIKCVCSETLPGIALNLSIPLASCVQILTSSIAFTLVQRLLVKT